MADDIDLAEIFNAADDAWKVGVVFRARVVGGYPPEDILPLVTPESERQWGDFTAVRDLFYDTTITTGIDYPAPGVAYTKVLTATDEGYVLTGDELIMARAIITLVRHPERGWLVHAAGDYVRPEDAPRYG